jgi:DASS family divalent anion:Na+ symporter
VKTILEGENHIPPEELAAKLAQAPVFSKCNHDEIVGLLPFVTTRLLKSGDSLCRAGDAADDTWIVLRGRLRVELDKESSRDVTADSIVGEEAALGIDTYLADIAAVDETLVLVLPKTVIPERLLERESRAPAFSESLLRIFTSAKTSFVRVLGDDDDLTVAKLVPRIIGWIAATVLPLLLIHYSDQLGLNWEQRQLAAALLSGAMLWIFGLVPPYVTGLIVVFVCVTLGVVPTPVILSGFASSGFFLALSVFCLGAVVIESGFITRFFLLVMKHCPRSALMYEFFLMLMGVVLTPLMPSETDRARILAPLIGQSGQSLRYARGSQETTRLMVAGFMGFTLFAPMLLTGSLLNLTLYGAMPEQVQDGFSWLHWFAAAAVAGSVLFVGYFVATTFVFRRSSAPRLSQELVNAQLKVLGPMRTEEWLAIGGGALFLGAVSTVSLHKIDHRLIGLTVICGYLVLGALGRTQLNVDIEWSSLILLGTLVGGIATAVYVDLHTVLGAHLGWLNEIMKYHPRTFVAMLAATVLIAGLRIPLAGPLIVLFVIPLAVLNGINPWIVVFVVLLMNDCWFWPSQSKSYLAFRNAVQAQTNYDERLFLKVNAATVVLRVIALVVSVAYWEYLRIL